MERMQPPNDIAKRMKERRNALGLSLKAVADKAGISKSTLQRYETGGIRNLPMQRLESLSNALHTTPDWLLGWTNTATRIKEVREREGYSKESFAEALGISCSELTDYENEMREPPYDFLLKVAHIFGTTVDYLLNRSNDSEWPSEIGRGTFGETELERCVAVLIEGTGFVFSNTAGHHCLDMIAGAGESVSITEDEWKQLVSNIVSYTTYTTKTLYDKAREKEKDPKGGK